jgi:hypothetical protein
MAKLKYGRLEKNESGAWVVKLGHDDARIIAIEILKEHRSRLRKHIPAIKHTVKKNQAIKKERRIDYVIGRMVFFKEDISTAVKRLEQEVKQGAI